MIADLIARAKMETYIEQQMKRHAALTATADCEQARFGHAVAALTLQQLLDQLYAGNFNP